MTVLYEGEVLTPAQWQALFNSKQDYLGYIPMPQSGGAMTGPLRTYPSTTSSAGFNVPPGTAPTSPLVGAYWATTTALFWRDGNANTTQLAMFGPTLALPIALIKTSVDFNVGTTDTIIPVTLPTGFTRFVVSEVRISGASADLSSATAGLFTAAAGGGVAIVSAASPVTVTGTSENTNNNTQAMTVANANTESYNAANLYFRVATAAGVAATATVSITIKPVP